MKIPHFQWFGLFEGVLPEATPDEGRLVLWLPLRSEDQHKSWLRISTLPGSSIETSQGLCSVAAAAVEVRQRLRGVVGRFWERICPVESEKTWHLPNGTVGESVGSTRNDLLVVWSSDRLAVLDEPRIRSRWPTAESVRQIGQSLFLVAGVTAVSPEEVAPPPAPTFSEKAPPIAPPISAKAPPPSAIAAETRKFAKQALEDARKSGDRRRQAWALADLAALILADCKAGEATPLLEEARELARQLGDRSLEVDVVAHLGTAALIARDVKRGLALLEEALQSARGLRDRIAERNVLGRLAHGHVALQDRSRAIALFGEAITLDQEIGDHDHAGNMLWQQSVQHAELGQRDQAEKAAQRAIDLWREIGKPQASWFAQHLDRYRAGGEALSVAKPGEAGDVTDMFLGSITASMWTPTTPSGPTPQPTGPSLLQMALSSTKAMLTFIGSGMKTTPAPVQKTRLELCSMCEHHTGLRCRVCGCFTAAKTRMLHERCPLGKW